MGILTLDVAFRTTGFVYIQDDNPELSGIIMSTKKKNEDVCILKIFYPDNEIKIYQETYYPKQYKVNSYLEVLKIYKKFLDTLFNLIVVDKVVAELPQTGGMDSRSTTMMSLALCFYWTYFFIKKKPIEIIQPSHSKKLIKLYLKEITKTKQDSIDVIKKFFPEVILPKQKGLQEHICDAYLAYLVSKN